MKTKVFSFIFLLSLISNVSFSQSIEVFDTYPVEDLIGDTLVSGCVQIENITHTGNVSYFTKSNSEFIMNSGILLTSGPGSIAIGPNNDGGAGSDVNGGSDPDLADIAGNNIYDATIVEFDFIPGTDTVSFDYIFASEEYIEYVNAGYNDVFGFFLSGPGITGPYSNNAINIALIPNTTTPVSIDNVNNSLNSQYFIHNENNNFPDLQNAIQYDGLTTILTAEAIVTPNQTYHIKLAISDVGDGILDSGVFLLANSFSSGDFQVKSTLMVDNESNRFCNEEVPDSLLAHIQIEGPDIAEINYQWSTGSTNDSLIIYPEYGINTYYVTVSDNCNGEYIDSLVIKVSDFSGFELDHTEEVTCHYSCNAMANISTNDGIAPYTYFWDNGSVTNTPNINSLCIGEYNVVVKDAAGCTNEETMIINGPEQITFNPEIESNGDACGYSIYLNPAGGTPPYTYQWNQPELGEESYAENLCESTLYTTTITDNNNCHEDTLIYISPNSMEKLSLADDLIYPNPAVKGKPITINLSYTKLELNIYSLNGEKIASKIYQNNSRIYLPANIESGIYYVKLIIDEHYQKSSKIIIED